MRAGAEVTFAGTPGARRGDARPRGRATRSTPSACRACRARPSLALARALALDVAAPAACLRILRRRRPHAVLGGGGFVAGPDAAGRARARHPARARPRPTRTSASPTGSRRRSPTASSSPIRCAGREAAALRGRRAPGRARLLRDDARGGARGARPAARTRFVLAVFGALAGARRINDACVAAYGARRPRRRHRPARHRARATTRASREARDARRPSATACSRRATASGRCSRPPTSRVSRAGGTVWELAAAGLPALLVPYPHATGDHQRANARHFAAAGGAVIVEDAALDGDLLRTRVAELRAEPGAARRDARRHAQLRAARRRRGRRARAAAPRAGPRRERRAAPASGIGGAGMSGIARVLRGHGRTRLGLRSLVRGRRASCAPRASTRVVGHDPAHLRPDMEVIVSSAVDDDEPELVGRPQPRAARAPPRRRAGRDRRVGRRHLRGRRARQDEHDRADRVRARGSAARSRRSWSAATCRSSAPTRASAGAASSSPRPTSRTARSRGCGRAPPSCSTPSSTITTTSARSTTCTRSSATGSPSCRREGVLVLHDVARLPEPTPSCAASARAPGEGWRALDVAPDGEGTRFVLAAPGPRAAAAARSPSRARTTRSTRPPRSRCSTGPGISPERAAAPLAAFRGAAAATSAGERWRGIRLVDDYAHHPSELAATLARRARRGGARAPAGLLPAAHAVAHAHVRGRLRRGAAAGRRRLRVRRLRRARRRRPRRHAASSWSQSARRQDAGLPDRLDARPTPTRPSGSCARARPGDLVLTLGAGPVDAVLELVRERLA